MNVINGDIGDVMFDRPSRSFSDYVEDKVNVLSSLGSLRESSERLLGNMRRSFERSSGIARSISIRRDLSATLTERDGYLSYRRNPRSIVTSNQITRMMTMSNPRLKRLYLLGEVSAFDGDYLSDEPNTFTGEKDSDYREATNGLTINRGEYYSSISYFGGQSGSYDIDMVDRSLISEIWRTSNDAMEMDIDITSPFIGG